jgi:hypothetical protein
MKKLIIGCFALLASSTGVFAQSEQEMKMWMEYMTPSEVHKMMSAWDGEWNEEITFWPAPGAPEQSMKATCTNRMLLGGRYQEGKHAGDFSGMPFEGLGTLAWDNHTKTFISTWIDNMGTGMMILYGKWDAKTKTINFTGEMTDAATGKVLKVREELVVVDDKTQMLTQYTMMDGKEHKNMQIKMTRKA